jgi:hypothetical protein
LLARKMQSSGTVSLNQTITLGSLTINNSASYTLAGTGRIQFDVSSGHASLDILNRGSHTLDVDLVALDDLLVFIDRGSALSFGSNGSLDLGTSKLVVDSGATSLLSTVAGWRDAGTLFSSDASLSTTLVVLDNQLAALTQFGSIAVDDRSVLAALALNGDSDFDGSVGFADLLTLAQNYGGTGIWTQGDFTGDGAIDFADLLTLAQNYGQSLLASAPAHDASSFASDWALARSLVPEPGLLGLAGLIGVALRRMR